jgi:hypothetical protein
LSRLRILTLFIALVALTATLAACGSGGGSDDPQTVVDNATLQGIESGDIDLTLGVDVKGEKAGHVDVSLSGPFQSESEAELPELDMTATAKGSIDGEKIDFDGGLVLLGDEAYVGYEGVEYEVDTTTLNFVKGTLQSQGRGQRQSDDANACQEVLGELNPGDFIDQAKSDGSADVGGTETTKVSGDLDASGAIEALTELSENPACSERLGSVGPLPSRGELDKAKSQVQDSVKDAHIDLYVGDDDIVRRIAVQATIEPPRGSGNGGAKTVKLDLDLTLTGVNEDQTISAPQGARPLSQLFLKLGINPIELLGLLEGEGGFGGGGAGGLGGLLEGLGSSGSTQ